DNYCFRIEIHLDGYRNCSPIYIRDVDDWQELETTIYQFDGFLTGQYYFRVCYMDKNTMTRYKEIYRQWHVYFWLPPFVTYSLPYNPPSTSKPTPTLIVLNKTSGNGSSGDPFRFDGTTIQFRIGATGQNLTQGAFLWAIQALGSTEGSCFRSPTRYWKSQTSSGDTKLSANQAFSGTYGSLQEIAGVMAFDFEGDRCLKSSRNTFLLRVQAIDKWGNYGLKSWEVYYYCGESVPKGVLGNLVWYDLNEDGIQDEGEPGVYGVKVTLDDGSTALTNEGGLYTFYNIDSNDYTAHFTELPEGYTFTAQNQGKNDLVDSDADKDGFTAVVTVPPDGANTSLDAGIIPIGGQIGDYIWWDQN
ncbi:hypothetical protein KAH55_03820, partial [bacterium]|nr:hypothetical protein [bacterium]